MARFSDRLFMISLILSIAATIILLTFSVYSSSYVFLRTAAYSSAISLKSYLYTRPIIVIGILSAEQNVCFRNAQRQMFVSQAKAYTSLDIKVFFLLDSATPMLEEERLLHNDIFYFNSSVHGWNKEFAKKLFSWYKFVERTFPDAILVGRMDDDVFSCVPQIFDRLLTIKGPLLYYGYKIKAPKKCPTNDCIDDMFVFVGMEIVRRIVKGHLCVDQNIKNCSQDGLAWQKLREWISPFSNETRFENDNSQMIFFYDSQKDHPDFKVNASVRMRNLYDKYGKSFCKKYLLFHKASVKYIYEMNKENAFELGDQRRMEAVEEEMRKANDCVTK